jgi:hypothetical protein
MSKESGGDLIDCVRSLMPKKREKAAVNGNIVIVGDEAK